jgi:hypothetical protein
MVITDSEFEGNTATFNDPNPTDGNNIYNLSGDITDVTCDGGTNTFSSPADNWPADLCE